MLPFLKHFLTLLRLTESDAELNALKVMVDYAVAFFYPGESSSETQAPHMLDSLPTRSRDIILTNMRESVSLTFSILKYLYPRADLDATSEDFIATCSDEEALKLIEDFAVTARHIMDMLGVDMSLG
jgi:hypothetical protein